MCSENGPWIKLATAALLLCASRVSFALVNVVNYDNHPDLEKAKEYDLTIGNERFRRADGSFDQEQYRAYQAGANRELAEQYYLAYLQDVDESFQRAAVYARLGEMFSGSANPSVATSIDKDKARRYYRKALEAEPERIGWPTLQARGFLAVDADNLEERFASYMDYYQWLLSIDAQTLKEKALPTRPPGTHRARIDPGPELNEAQKKRAARMKESMAQAEKQRPAQSHSSEYGMVAFLQTHGETTARNLIHEAVGRMAIDPETGLLSEARAIQHLLMLVERFPGESVAERAKLELERVNRE